MERGISPFREGGMLRVCLVYPNSYAVGAVNLGFATLFRMLNENESITCERAFALEGPTLSGKNSSFIDEPRSIETLRSLNEFSIIAFSCMSEFDYLNAVTMLTEAGIPWRKDERRTLANGETPGEGISGRWPLILAGGAAPTLNPLPLVEMADVVVRGEWESSGPEIADLMVLGWKDGDHRGIVDSLSTWSEGSTNSSLSYTGEKGLVICEGTLILSTEPVKEPMAWLDLISDESVFSQMGLVEGTRGCPYTCRFCSARRLYNPFRIVPPEKILEYVRSVREDCNRIGLVGAGISAHPQLCDILEEIRKLGLGVSLSSLRLDRVSDRLLELLSDSGQKTVTVAPESFNPVTLELLNKRPPKNGFAEGFSKLLSASFPVVKSYMMMGIPGDDFVASVDEAAKVFKALGKLSRSIELSYSIFQPKPGTAMATESIAPSKTLKREAKAIRKVLGPLVRSISIPGLKIHVAGDLLSRGGTDAISIALNKPFSKKEAAASIENASDYWMKA